MEMQITKSARLVNGICLVCERISANFAIDQTKNRMNMEKKELLSKSKEELMEIILEKNRTEKELKRDCFYFLLSAALAITVLFSIVFRLYF